MTTTGRSTSETGTPVLAMGAGTLAAALGAAAFLMTYQGIGLVGYRAAATAALSIVLLICTVIAFVRTDHTQHTPARAVLGLTLAIAAFPAVLVLAAATYAILGALGITW